MDHEVTRFQRESKEAATKVSLFFTHSIRVLLREAPFRETCFVTKLPYTERF